MTGGESMVKKGLGIFFLLLLIAGPGYSQSVDAVLIISIDALRPDALSEKTSPAVFRLMKEGRFTLKGTSVDPPKTLIAHTSMMTGLPPAKSGKTDNEWKPGDARVGKETLFDGAKRAGFHTAFFYSKTKLGYLVNGAVDEYALAPDDGIARTGMVIERQGKQFVFLHISGLEYEGMESDSSKWRDAFSSHAALRDSEQVEAGPGG